MFLLPLTTFSICGEMLLSIVRNTIILSSYNIIHILDLYCMYFVMCNDFQKIHYFLLKIKVAYSKILLTRKKSKFLGLLFLQWAGIAQSVQQLATGWTGRGSNPGGGEICRTRPDRPWGLPSLLYNGCRVFPGGKAAGAWCRLPTPI